MAQIGGYINEVYRCGDLPIAPTLTTDPIFIDLKQHIMYMSRPHPPHYQVKYDHDQQIIHPYTTLSAQPVTD